MAEENEQEDPRTLFQQFMELAQTKGLDDDDADAFVEAKMRRAGYKKGPGDWISEDEEEDEDKDDDNTPMTRGDWRRMQRQRKKESARQLPKKEDNSTKSSTKNKDPWW